MAHQHVGLLHGCLGALVCGDVHCPVAWVVHLAAVGVVEVEVGFRLLVHPVDGLAGSPCAVVCEAHVVDMVPAGQQRLHLAVDTVHYIQTRSVAVLEGHIVVQDGIFAGHAYGVYVHMGCPLGRGCSWVVWRHEMPSSDASRAMATVHVNLYMGVGTWFILVAFRHDCIC